MADRAELQMFMEYQGKINDLFIQQNRQMNEFQNTMRQMIDERLKQNGNGKSNVVMKILFGILLTLVVGITSYYVKENDDWKKEMRSDFNILQTQVFNNTAANKSSLTRIETILESRFPEARKK